MKYFAYGSNMSEKRILKRCPGAVNMGFFTLQDYLLSFDNVGGDGSGKCSVRPCNQSLNDRQEQSNVYGVVYEIPLDEIELLDRAEALGKRYDKIQTQVSDIGGQKIDVFLYVGKCIDKMVKPFDWYLTHVNVGAVEAGLPVHYIEQLQLVGSIVDPDTGRKAKEMAIYI